MRFLIFIPPKNFRDESLSLVKLFFDKWGIRYMVTSYSSTEAVGLHGAVVRPDINTSKINYEEYDGIVLIDGVGADDYRLYDYRPLLDLMLMFNQRKGYIISINNSTKIPARANIINNVLISTDDEESRRLVRLFHGVLSEKPFEINGNIITIRNSKDVEESMQAILERIGK
jgi:putative intracellular protease/amidase